MNFIYLFITVGVLVTCTFTSFFDIALHLSFDDVVVYRKDSKGWLQNGRLKKSFLFVMFCCSLWFVMLFCYGYFFYIPFC